MALGDLPTGEDKRVRVQDMFDRIARQPPKDVLAEPEEVETKRRADMETLAKLRVACQALSSLST